jgi:hypothetical protein
MMLKLFFWLLLIANGALFAMQRGYLGATASARHEPQRLTQQLQPQTLSILPPDSVKLAKPAAAVAPVAQLAPPDSAEAKPEALPLASSNASADSRQAAKPAPKAQTIACIEIGNFNTVEARKFEAQLAVLNLAARPLAREVHEAGSYMVYIPSQEDKDGAERRSAELGRLGIQDFYVMPESQPNPALRWSISLGVFKTEEAAKAYVGQLIPKGVRSARIIARNVSSTRHAYQWRDIDPATKATLDGLQAKFPAQEARSCPG